MLSDIKQAFLMVKLKNEVDKNRYKSIFLVILHLLLS